MNTKQILGLIGSVVLLIGVFTPNAIIVSMGSRTYFQNVQGDDTIILVFAVISLVMTLMEKYKVLWFTGSASLAVMLFTFINFQTRMSQFRADMELELADNPFRGLAEMAISSVQLQWGWAFLVVGAALVITSAALKNKTQ